MLIRATVLMLTLAFMAGCARAVRMPVVDPATIADATITAAVTTALLNNPHIDGTQIAVRTEAGVVRLDGNQPTPQAAAEVVSIARDVQGVRDVQSAITVAAASEAANSARPKP